MYKNTKRGRKWEKSDPGYESELLLKLTQRAHKKNKIKNSHHGKCYSEKNIFGGFPIHTLNAFENFEDLLRFS